MYFKLINNFKLFFENYELLEKMKVFGNILIQENKIIFSFNSYNEKKVKKVKFFVKTIEGFFDFFFI